MPSSVTSWDLGKEFTFQGNFIKVSAPNVYLERFTLFFHYNGVYFSHKDSHLEGNYKNTGVFFYENVGQPFLLYQFYLEVFSRALFNNLKKKTLTLLFKDYSGTFGDQQKYPTVIMFQEKISEKLYRLSADLVCMLYTLYVYTLYIYFRVYMIY